MKFDPGILLGYMVAMLAVGLGLCRCSSVSAAEMLVPGEALARNQTAACVSYSALVYNPGSAAIQLSSARLAPGRFDRVAFDDGGFWNPARPGALRIPEDGRYLLQLRSNFRVKRSAPFPEAVGRRLIFQGGGRRVVEREHLDSYHDGGYWPTLESVVQLDLRTDEVVEVFGQQSTEAGYDLRMSLVDLRIQRICD